MSGIHNLPYVDVQHDAIAVFDDVEQGVVAQEDIWISSYHIGEMSVHGKARVAIQKGGEASFTAREGVKSERITKTDFLVDVPVMGIIKRPVHFPKHAIDPPYTKISDLDPPLQINSISINPKTPHMVIGGPDGYCMVLPTGVSSSPDREGVNLRGHVGDVRAVKWFPSGEVILTASSDLSVRIFGLSGINPRTFKGHTRAVTSLAIIGVGKSILSGSKDGTIRLWDVAKGKEVRQWKAGGSGVEGLILVEDSFSLEALGLSGQENAALAHTQEGIWVQPTEGEGWMVAVDGQVSSFAYERSTGTIAVGHTSGIVDIRDIASLEKESLGGSRKRIRRNDSPVYSLEFSPTSTGKQLDLYMGTAVGLPCRLGVRVTEDGFDVDTKVELAGWNAVGVKCIAVGKDGVWCGGGEGTLRRYSP